MLIAAAALGTATADEVIDPAHAYAWGENVGWTNWRDAGEPPGSEGVRVHATFLSGFVWGEAVGWIHLGSGMPADGEHYANLDGGDSGVNVDATGDLYGYAWGENIGWLNFDTRSQGEQRARLDRAAQRFRGYVWGENVGWINLDDDEQFVGLLSGGQGAFRRGDVNEDAEVDISDALHSIGCLFLGLPCTQCKDAGDSNDDGKYDISDPIHTLNWLFAGGPLLPAPGPFACGDDLTPGDSFADCIYEACP
jgi:hypothetical protein